MKESVNPLVIEIERLREQLAAERELRDACDKIATALAHENQQFREQLVAEREALNAASRFMDYLRANTGISDEWPIELKVAPDAIEPINTLLNEFESKVYAITKSK